MHPNLILIGLTSLVSIFLYVGSGNLPNYIAGADSFHRIQRFILPSIVLNECLSLEKNMFNKNIVPLLYYGLLFGIFNIGGLYVSLKTILDSRLVPGVQNLGFGIRTTLVISTLLGMGDFSGYKMVLTTGRRVNSMLKGSSLINFVLCTLVGYVMSYERFHKKDEPDTIKGRDFLNLFLVLGSSIVFAMLAGIVGSLVFIKASWVRINPITEILFFFFMIYLVSVTGIYDYKFDWFCQELILTFYATFCSHFTRYNLSLEAGKRLCFFNLIQTEMVKISILAIHGISFYGLIFNSNGNLMLVGVFVATMVAVRSIIYGVFWLGAKYFFDKV